MRNFVMQHLPSLHKRFYDILLLVWDHIKCHINFLYGIVFSLFDRIFYKWIHNSSKWSPCFSHMITEVCSWPPLSLGIKLYFHNLISCNLLIYYFWDYTTFSLGYLGIFPVFHDFLKQVGIWKNCIAFQ